MPSLHMAAMASAVVRGTRASALAGMATLRTSARESATTWPYRMFRGCDAGAGVSPYCSVTAGPGETGRRRAAG